MREVLRGRGYRLGLKSAKLVADYYIEHNAFPRWKWSVIPVEEYRNGELKPADGK